MRTREPRPSTRADRARPIRRLRALAISAWAVPIAVAVVLIPGAGPAGATGATITVSSTTLVADHLFTISGKGWSANGSIEVALLQGSTPTDVCAVSANASGVVYPQACTAPTTLPSGSYRVLGTEGSTTATVSSPVTLAPGVTLSTPGNFQLSSVAVGQVVDMDGYGFAPSSTVKATFAGAKLILAGTTMTSAQGTLSSVTFQVPPGEVGHETIVLKDGSGHSATTPLQVFAPTLSVKQTTVASGHTFVASGSGWRSGQSVSLDLESTSATGYACSLQVAVSGKIPSQTCTVPATVPVGTYSLVASDSQLSTTVATAFKVVPAIALDGASNQPTGYAAPGQSIGVSGSGFTGTSPLRAFFNGKPVTLDPAVSTSAIGSFSGTDFIVPSVSAGTYQVEILGNGGHSATAPVKIVTPTVSVSPNPGASGQPVSVSGHGWLPYDRITVDLVQAGTAANLCQAAADASGAIAPQTCSTPAYLPRGTYAVEASDGSISVAASTPFTLDPAIAVTSGGEPTSIAAPGDTLGLSGSGFAGSSTISATLNGKPLALGSDIVTGTQGTFASVNIVVPTTTAVGPVTIAVHDAGGHSATVPVTITAPKISVTPNPAVAGSPLDVTGSGWPPFDQVSIRLLQGSTVVSFVCTVKADDTGTIVGGQSCATYSSQAAGSYTINAADQSLNVDQTAAFTVTAG